MEPTQKHTDTLIHEYQAMLQPCKHCGNKHPQITYQHHPNKIIIPGKKHPHGVQVKCTKCCKIQTDTLFAEDDPNHSDFKEALRLLVLMWNKNPNTPDDPAVTEMYAEKYHEFKTQEEAKEYYESRGKPYDKNTTYLGILLEPLAK